MKRPRRLTTAPLTPLTTSLDGFARQAADEARATGATTLDVGPGEGPFGRHFDPSRYHFLCVDPPGSSPLTGLGFGGLRSRPVVDALPFDDERYGLALCAGAVEVSPEPPGLLAELNRVLAAEARLFLASPLIVPEAKSGRRYPYLSRYGLNYLLEAAGFTIEDLRPLSTPSAYGIIARKARPRG